MDLHLNLKFAGRSISFRPKSFEPVPSGTALIPLLAPSSPVESRLTLQSSESEIAHQQSQLPTASSFLMSPTGKKSLKLCKILSYIQCCLTPFCVNSDEEWDQPLITEEAFFCWTLHVEIDTRILQKPLVQYSVLSETSFHIMQGLRMQHRRSIRFPDQMHYLMYIRWHGMEILFPDQMHYLMYILGKRENGLQILYRCLKKTQHRFPEHRRIVQDLERKGGQNLITS